MSTDADGVNDTAKAIDRAAKFRAIVERLAREGPPQKPESNEYSRRCGFCDVSLEVGLGSGDISSSEHEPSCLWRLAVEAVK